MAYTTTTNYGLKKGSGGTAQSIEQQRVYDNENADTIDSTMKAISDAADAAQADANTAQASADTAQGEVDALENIVSTKSDKNGIVSDSTFNSAWKSGTASIDAVTGTITLTGHGLTNGDEVEFDAGTGVLPTGILPYNSDSVGGTYYNVINVVGNTFQVTATVGGSTPVIPADTGTPGWQIRIGSVDFGGATIALEIGQEVELFALVEICKNAVGVDTFNLSLAATGLTYDSYYGMRKTLNGATLNVTASKKYSRHIMFLYIKKVSADCYFYRCISSGSSTDNKSSYTNEPDKTFTGFAYGSVNNVGIILGRNSGTANTRNGSRLIVIRR